MAAAGLLVACAWVDPAFCRRSRADWRIRLGLEDGWNQVVARHAAYSAPKPLAAREPSCTQAVAHCQGDQAKRLAHRVGQIVFALPQAESGTPVAEIIR